METYYIVSPDPTQIRQALEMLRTQGRTVRELPTTRHGITVGPTSAHGWGDSLERCIKHLRQDYPNRRRVTASKWIAENTLGVESTPDEPVGYTGDERIEIPEEYYEPEYEYDGED